MRFILMYEGYSSKSSERNQELLQARWKNEGLFDSIISWPSTSNSGLWPNKRLTFLEAFEYFNANYGEGDVLVLANADISFECFNFRKAELLLTDSDPQPMFISLSRYEIHYLEVPGTNHKGQCVNKRVSNMLEQNGNNLSQDTWIGKWPIKTTKCPVNCECYKLGLPDKPTDCMNFYLGVPGCDSRMNTLLTSVYDVINPVSCLITIHNHKSEIREGTSAFHNFGVVGIPGKYTGIDFS